MARKKVTPEEEIVNTAVEGTALGSVPAGSVLHDEAGADTGDVPAELPEGDLSAEETAEQSETLPAMEAAEAKPFGLFAAEKTASQEENDTVEKRAEDAELHEETSEFLEAAEDLHSNLPASAPHGSEADGADWGFEEPVTVAASAAFLLPVRIFMLSVPALPAGCWRSAPAAALWTAMVTTLI